MVQVFGRATPVVLDYTNVEKAYGDAPNIRNVEKA